MLAVLVQRHGGVVTRATALQVVPRWVLDRAIRSHELVAVLPGVYADARLTPATTPPAKAAGRARATAAGTAAGRAADALLRLHPQDRHRAVAAYAAGQGALSLLTALHVWGLRDQPPGEPLHLDVPQSVALRGSASLVVHRRSVPHTRVVARRGLPVVPLDRTLVGAWPLLAAADRADPLFRAVNERRTTPARIRAALSTAPNLRHRAGLGVLLDRLAAGCRSPLEIWGHDHVFTGPRMPVFRRQERVRVGAHTYYLDMYAEAERVDIELDGATAHGGPRQREIDLRRDAVLATAGILVLRFARHRLVHEVDEVRRETLAVLATRRGPWPVRQRGCRHGDGPGSQHAGVG